jgi:hypothetical protein
MGERLGKELTDFKYEIGERLAKEMAWLAEVMAEKLAPPDGQFFKEISSSGR